MTDASANSGVTPGDLDRAQHPVGIVGLGTMGNPIAGALRATGRDVVGFDAVPEAVTALSSLGVLPAESAAEVARRCRVMVLSLPTPEVVLAVVREIAEAATPHPPVVLDTSTVGPQTSRDAAGILSGVGAAYADCPVLGRPAAIGRWTIPVGGPEVLVATAAQTFAPVARHVVGVGATGAAATMKVLNNLMLGVINASTAEVLVLAEAAGLDPGVFADTLAESGAASISGLFREVAPRAVAGDFAPVFSVRLMHKDNALALELARRHGLATAVADAAQSLNQAALDAGLGEEDSIAVIKAVRQIRDDA